MSDTAVQAPPPHGANPHALLHAQDAPAPAASVPAADFLLYEEYSVYRREFLGRAGSAAEAQAQALFHSRRSRQAVIVRRKEAGSLTSAFVSAYRAGRRVYPQTPATGATGATGATS
jgi:hypothetical protein